MVHGLLTARGRRRRLASMEDLWRLIAATIAGAAVIGLLAGLTAHYALGGTSSTRCRRRRPRTAPPVAHGAARHRGPRPAQTRPDAEDVVQWIVVIGVTFWVFHRGQSLPLVFLPIPGLVWGALRLGLRTVAVQLIVVGMLTVRLTTSEAGRSPPPPAAAASVRRPWHADAGPRTAALTALSLAVAAT